MEHQRIDVHVTGLLEHGAALSHLEAIMSELSDKVTRLTAVVSDVVARVDAHDNEQAAALADAQRKADDSRTAELAALSDATNLRADLDALNADNAAAIAGIDSGIATLERIDAAGAVTPNE